MIDGVLNLSFADPSFVRCEKVFIDIAQRSIGAILHEGYYEIGNLPDEVSVDALESLTEAILKGWLAEGREFQLNAPLMLLKPSV